MLVQDIGFEEYINLQRTLVELLRENLKNYPVICNYPDVSHRIMKERLSCGLPVLALEWLKMRIDHIIMENFFEKILLAIKKHRLISNENENKLQLIRKSNSFLPENMVFSYLKEHRGFILELNRGVNKIMLNLLGVIADTLSKHVVIDITRRVPRIDDRIKWKENYCPFCGGKPFLLIICEELQRIKLRCRICYTCWDFEQKKCPFCKNEDEKSIQTYYETEPSRFFLLFCEKCKKYIKAMKEKNGNGDNVEDDIFLTDAITIGLDASAESKGYKGI